MPPHPHLDVPSSPELRRRCQARAVLEAIIAGSAEEATSAHLRYNDTWRPDAALATWEDGQGNEWSAVFSRTGTYLRGYYRDSAMNPLHYQRNRLWDGLLDDLPSQFAGYVTDPDVDGKYRYAPEPDSAIPAITLCAWQLPDDRSWQGSDFDPPDEVDEELEGLEYLFRDVVEWSSDEVTEALTDYHELDLDAAAVVKVLGRAPLTLELVTYVNPDADTAWVLAQAVTAGYPS